MAIQSNTVLKAGRTSGPCLTESGKPQRTEIPQCLQTTCFRRHQRDSRLKNSSVSSTVAYSKQNQKGLTVHLWITLSIRLTSNQKFWKLKVRYFVSTIEMKKQYKEKYKATLKRENNQFTNTVQNKQTGTTVECNRKLERVNANRTISYYFLMYKNKLSEACGTQQTNSIYREQDIRIYKTTIKSLTFC